MSSRIVVSLRIAASPEVVFDAFVDDIAVWWRPNGLFAFTPRSPGVMAFEDGRLVERLPNGKVFEVGVVSVWERGARLVFGWRQAAFTPDMNTEVEVRFEAVGEGTRVTVEHRGWDSVPAPHVARHGFPNAAFLARHGEWWRNLLAGLAARANSVHLGAGDEGLS
ncbi:ATPase [Caulobacter vibrioides]|uniref:SRPBCC domain-containing protein n=1 Tax=Caulobacter vibrioides TaxID=155892 RepID=UPI000BB4B608|nr:SRPBCC domain-containing protein [Caulobacter vibrioides]ATC24214.1 ATPase [Caulobacter vibrioides]AZH12461.1 ATPase [Caulobacter vibrioides]PLR08222.1 ATPase [Caulobacter vibrioides]